MPGDWFSGGSGGSGKGIIAVMDIASWGKGYEVPEITLKGRADDEDDNEEQIMKTFDELKAEVEEEKLKNDAKRKADYFGDVEKKLKELIHQSLYPCAFPRFKAHSFILPCSDFNEEVVMELQKDPRWLVQKIMRPGVVEYIVSINQ